MDWDITAEEIYRAEKDYYDYLEEMENDEQSN